MDNTGGAGGACCFNDTKELDAQRCKCVHLMCGDNRDTTFETYVQLSGKLKKARMH